MPKLLPVVDTEPESGVYVDHDAFHLSDQEAAEGNDQAARIDIADDNDNGLD